MGGASLRGNCKFSSAIRRYRSVGGAIDRDGRVVRKPWALEEAELIDGICQRYGCLPSQLMDEPATVLRTLAIVQEGNPAEENGE